MNAQVTATGEPGGTFSREDVKYMKEALKQAQKALALGEVPIGAVIVMDGKIIGRGYNRRNTDHTTLAHARLTGKSATGVSKAARSTSRSNRVRCARAPWSSRGSTGS